MSRGDDIRFAGRRFPVSSCLIARDVFSVVVSGDHKGAARAIFQFRSAETGPIA